MSTHHTHSARSLCLITGISRQGRSISYNIRQGDELQHHKNETSSAFQQQKWTKVYKMD